MLASTEGHVGYKDGRWYVDRHRVGEAEGSVQIRETKKCLQ